MSDYSEEEVDVKPTKKQITDAQRTARIENLRKGRETRMKNVEAKKTKLAKKAKTETYKVPESE